MVPAVITALLRWPEDRTPDDDRRIAELHGRVRAMAMSHGGGPERADEIAAQAMANLIGRVTTAVRDERVPFADQRDGNVDAYMVTVVRHLAARPVAAAEPLPPDVSARTPAGLSFHAGAALEQALAALAERFGPDRRALVEAHYLDGVKVTPLAKLVNLTAGVVRERLTEAVAFLRGRLKGSFSELDVTLADWASRTVREAV
jgi:DNA-directed RNA polymerase specialized sigma24 family protein